MADDRTYNPELLALMLVTSLDFSRTYIRTLLRDRPEFSTGGVPLGPGQPTRASEATWPQYSRTDLEINTALVLDSVLDPTPAVRYYRPHITAARLYLGDPALWKTRNVDGSSESRRDTAEIVAAWLAQGVSLDAQIPESLKPLPPFVPPGQTTTGEAPSTPTKLPGSTVVIRAEGGW